MPGKTGRHTQGLILYDSEGNLITPDQNRVKIAGAIKLEPGEDLPAQGSKVQIKYAEGYVGGGVEVKYDDKEGWYAQVTMKLSKGKLIIEPPPPSLFDSIQPSEETDGDPLPPDTTIPDDISGLDQNPGSEEDEE